ncbi:MAG TPA: RodZ domain-containing protein, partial [Verrucomicrobiae bacterium]|nr:RodZ domain-containing protein [Verrucomicrobiae bacterium]
KGQGIWIGIAVIVLAALGFALADRKPAERLAPAPVETPAAAPAPQSGPQTQPQPEATAIPTPSVQGAEPAGNPVATTPPAAAPAPEPAPEPAPLADAGPAATPGQLVLEFSEASFIRVEDTRGRTLAIGLVRGGERKALDGQPPYTVFLGNAQNVKVRFGGAPVDFSAHINAQNDTARFTVP